MDFIKEINNLFESEVSGMTDTIFVMRTASCPEGKNWDRIGFVLSNGKLKDMVDSYYDKPSIQTSNGKIEHIHRIKEPKLAKVKKNLGVKYEEFKLNRMVSVMDKFHHYKPKDCGSYVLAVINKNRNIDGKKLIEPESYSIDSIYKAIKIANKKNA